MRCATHATMSSMRDLFNTPMFEPVLGYIDLQCEQIMAAPMLHLTAPATLQGVLALGQLEAACLDLGIKYSRRFFMPQSQRPHGEAHVHVLSLIHISEPTRPY